MEDTTSAGSVPTRLRLDPVWIATGCGIFSAIGYTFANICLRAVTHLDPAFVSEVKAIPTVLGLAPIVALRLWRKQKVMPSLSVFAWIVAIAFLGQVGGNVGFQSSLGMIGLALAVPINLGAMILGGAILGKWILGDSLTRGMMVASGVLVLAICVLSFGAPQASSQLQTLAARDGDSMSWAALGVLISCFSGSAYACLSCMLRFATNRGTPIVSLLFTVGCVGVLSLGTIVAYRFQGVPWQSVTPRDMNYLCGAGICNLVAFLALTRALQLTSVVFVNALSASQTAMAALAGVLLFGEPTTSALWMGIFLTAVGLFLTKGRRPAEPDAAIRDAEHAELESGH